MKKTRSTTSSRYYCKACGEAAKSWGKTELNCGEAGEDLREKLEMAVIPEDLFAVRARLQRAKAAAAEGALAPRDVLFDREQAMGE